jgi:hypothetical protein
MKILTPKQLKERTKQLLEIMKDDQLGHDQFIATRSRYYRLSTILHNIKASQNKLKPLPDDECRPDPGYNDIFNSEKFFALK